MAAMANNDFGIPCQHKENVPFAFTLTCPDCRLLRKLQSENQQREPEKKNSKKKNKKLKQQERKKKKYGNVF